MLSKLLRHEFRATGRIMLPVYALLLVSCGGCTLFGRLLGRYPESTVLSVVQTVFATLFGVTTFGMLLLTLVLMVYRFYKNLMTDEGYLMFTLPVSRSQLIWSKLLVALVWSVLSTVLAALAWMAEISVVGRENVFSLIAQGPAAASVRQPHRLRRGPGGAVPGVLPGVVPEVLRRHLPGPQLLQPQGPAVGGVLHRLRHRHPDHRDHFRLGGHSDRHQPRLLEQPAGDAGVQLPGVGGGGGVRPAGGGVLRADPADAEKAAESAIIPGGTASGSVKTTGPEAVFLWGPTRFSHPRKSPLTNRPDTAIMELFIKLFGEIFT